MSTVSYQIAHEYVGKYYISTAFIVVLGEFETMVMDDLNEVWVRRTPDETEALANHQLGCQFALGLTQQQSTKGGEHK